MRFHFSCAWQKAPSPLVGEGRGEGYGVYPPSLPFPHKGGRNFLIHAMRFHFSCAWQKAPSPPCTTLPARMVFCVQLLEALARNVRVNLRGRNIRVPQQHLHHAQVCAVIEQMGGKRMPQRMR